ncbi:MAG: hypothetical protein LBL66_03425 [Clostridiales bacterium]|jgi:hypothetical protein|nr:hypothetical protein [Clostridiales bacterium]
MGCLFFILRILKFALKVMWFILKLIFKVIVFLLFKLGLFLIGAYALGMQILDRFIYKGQLDIYGRNLPYYLIGLGLTVLATVLLWVRRRRRADKR